MSSIVPYSIADCNEAGWDAECLDICDNAYYNCADAAFGDYLSCKVWGEELQCWQDYQEAMVTCRGEYITCEASCYYIHGCG